MEKRFVVFIVFTMLVLTGHVFVQSMFAPPPPPVVDQDLVARDAGEATPADLGASDAESDLVNGEAGETNAPTETATASQPQRLTGATSGSQAIEAAPQTVIEQEWITLGSFDGTAGPLLVTITNKGGGLVRVELVERLRNGSLKYRNLEETSGYLGHLALTPHTTGGLRVNVVGRGTPAALAETAGDEPGLRVGDVISAFHTAAGAGGEVLGAGEFEQLLHETRPGDTIDLRVERGGPEQTETISFAVTLGVRPFQVLRPEPLAADESTPHPPSCLVSLTEIGGVKVADQLVGSMSPTDGIWQTRLLDDLSGVEFRFPLSALQLGSIGRAGSLELVKRFRLPRDAGPEGARNYHLEMEVELVNSGQEEQQIQYRLDGPNGLPLEGWWYAYKTHPRMFYSAGARDVLYRSGATKEFVGCPAIYKKAAERPDNPSIGLSNDAMAPLDYLAVDTQYFLSALLPLEGSGIFATADARLVGQLKPKRLQKTSNVSFRLVSPSLAIPPDSSLTHKFELFVGPKQPELLAEYGLGEAIYYGWFGAVSRPLSSILHFFFSLVRNYGLAIILLTVLVRGCMFPLSRKAAKNAAMMQELAPEMKAITEKYKSDMEKRAKAQQELFRKNNYNPLGGCWVMFLQLPIFIGLYRSLSVDIELRQAAFIPGFNWCSNLAGPDQLFFWGDMGFFGLFEKTGMLGPYFNILPLGTVALFLIQQKMFSPPATDDQTRMQLKVMKFMTLFIGIMFFKVASGLCLYFIASSFWGIAERKLLPKKNITTGDAPPIPEKRPDPKPRLAARNTPNGSSQKSSSKSKKKPKRR